MNNENKVIDNYTLSQSYYFKRIILAATSITNTLNTNDNSSDKFSSSYNLNTKNLSGDELNLQLSFGKSHFSFNFIPNSTSNLKFIEASLAAYSWYVSYNNNYSLISSNENLTQDNLANWIKENLSLLSASNSSYVTLIIYDSYNYTINGKSYYFPSTTQWSITIAFAN